MSKRRHNEHGKSEEIRQADDGVAQITRMNEAQEGGISLKELLLVLLNGKKVIAISMIAVMAIAFFGSVVVANVTFGAKGTMQSAIKLTFSGIEEGMTPTGEDYDPNTIRSTEVIRKAMAEIALSGNPTPAQVADCISLEAIIPDEAAKTLQTINELRTEQLKVEQLRELEIHPDTYIVTLRVANRLGITKEEGRNLLDQILLKYQESLVETYANYQTLEAPFSEKNTAWENLDYIQAVDLMNTHLNEMEKYIQKHLPDATFYSSSTGFSKTDLLEAIETLRNTEVERLYAKIAANFLTKDLGKQVAIYSELVDEKSKKYQKRQAEATALLALIQSYKRNSQSLVLGNVDVEEEEQDIYPLQAQDPNYDQLMNQYVEAGQEAAEDQSEVLYYQSELKRIQETSWVSSPETEAAKEVEQLLAKTKGNLAKWTEIENQTVKDYYWNSPQTKYAKQLVSAQEIEKNTSVKIGLNTGIGLLVGLLIGLLIVLFRAYLKEEAEQETKEVEDVD